MKKKRFFFVYFKKSPYLCTRISKKGCGEVAQLVRASDS